MQAAEIPLCPGFPQHLSGWLAEEKAQGRQQAVHSCMALLKFLSHDFYLDVSTVPLTLTALPTLCRARGVQGPQGSYPRIGWIPECRAARPGNPPFTHEETGWGTGWGPLHNPPGGALNPGGWAFVRPP